jgi:hypothetical protein
MENKQTAIEWFYQRILAKDIKSVFEQALAMEKEQITKAYDSGGDHYTDFGAPIWGIDYYNETYGKETDNN